MSIRGFQSIVPSPPIVVGGERQLLMDRHTVDSTWNLVWRVHQPTKHPANPLIPGAEFSPDGHVVPVNWGTVTYDRDMERFRFWSLLWITLCRAKEDRIGAQVYWESEDGIAWYAPELGLHEYNGSNRNNLIQLSSEIYHSTPSVVEVPERLRHNGRYAMVYGAVQREPLPGTVHGMSDRNLGFSSDPGYMLTRPIECPGGRLHINARTAPNGFIRVVVRTGHGEQDVTWLAGWNFEHMETEFTGDDTDAVVEWSGRETHSINSRARLFAYTSGSRTRSYIPGASTSSLLPLQSGVDVRLSRGRLLSRSEAVLHS
jgi:hypothetical protein